MFSVIQRKTSFGIIDYEAVTDAVTSATNKSTKRNRYQKWSPTERFDIGKYAALHGHAAAVRRFAKKEKPLNESSVRRFVKLYHEELKKASIQERNVQDKLAPIQRGRKLMLGSLD